MKRLICDIRGAIGDDDERTIVVEEETPYIDLPFFKDKQHEFKLHRCKLPQDTIMYYWELQVNEDEIIDIFPTHRFLYKEPRKWIEEIIKALDVPVIPTDEVFFILHDKDFADCNALVDGRQRCKYIYYKEDRNIVIKESKAVDLGDFWGRLLVFQHDYEDNFYYPLDAVDEFISWSDRWSFIKQEVLQW